MRDGLVGPEPGDGGMARATRRRRSRRRRTCCPKASDRERRLITARLQFKGLEGKFDKDDDRRAGRDRTLDELLALHEDDEEAWYARAQLAGDGRPSI